jgi:hypothetical protein
MTLDDVVDRLDSLILKFDTFFDEYINNSNLILKILDNIDILVYILIVVTIMRFMLRRVKIL